MSVVGELKILLEHKETSELLATHDSQAMTAEVKRNFLPVFDVHYRTVSVWSRQPSVDCIVASNDYNDNQAHVSDLSTSVPNEIENLWRLSDQSLLRSSLPKSGLACSQTRLHYDVVTNPAQRICAACT